MCKKGIKKEAYVGNYINFKNRVDLKRRKTIGLDTKLRWCIIACMDRNSHLTIVTRVTKSFVKLVNVPQT